MEAALLQSCRECQAIGDSPTAFKQMMGDMGGTGASKKLLNDNRLHDGFTRLWLLKRLDLTVECQVLNPRFGTLFTDEELDVARNRLRDLAFDPCNCERDSSGA